MAFSEVLPVPGGAESLLPLQLGSWPGTSSFHDLAWLEISFQVLIMVEFQKICLKTTSSKVYSGLWVRFDDTTFPPCGLRRWESEGVWNSGNGEVLSCFLLPKNCARASLLPLPRGTERSLVCTCRTSLFKYEENEGARH